MKSTKIFLSIAIVLGIITVSICSGFRDFYIGTDTERYIFVYYHIPYYKETYIEFGDILFFEFSKFLRRLGLSRDWYLSTITLTITCFYLYAFIKSSEIINKSHGILFVFVLLLVSSWYLTETINGLRQGMGLAIIYIALAFIGKRTTTNFICFCVLFLIAMGFHNASAILLILFLPLHFLSLKNLSYFYIIAALFAITGITEQCIKILSNTLNLDIYNRIKYYSIHHNAIEFSGYRKDIFIYTVFWGLCFIFLKHFIKIEYQNKFDIILKNFIILSFPYMMFGFGEFSNRYAIIAWFYLPLIQASFISFLKLPHYLKYITFIIAYPIAIVKYVTSVS